MVRRFENQHQMRFQKHRFIRLRLPERNPMQKHRENQHILIPVEEHAHRFSRFRLKQNAVPGKQIRNGEVRCLTG